jgi:hypothetical protein
MLLILIKNNVRKDYVFIHLVEFHMVDVFLNNGIHILVHKLKGLEQFIYLFVNVLYNMCFRTIGRQ